jgi:hypothetical protein
MSRHVIDGYNDDDDEYIHRFILNRQHDDYEFGMNEIELEEDYRLGFLSECLQKTCIYSCLRRPNMAIRKIFIEFGAKEPLKELENVVEYIINLLNNIKKIIIKK